MKFLNNLTMPSFKMTYLYILAFLILRLDLVFLNTMPTGGDMGAHVVPIKYFIDNFALNFQLNGWSNDWFAGYPLYFFYFPFPAVLTFFLNLIFPYPVAFKLMVVGSIIITIYSFERIFRKNQSNFSFLGFVAGITYVLTESFTIYGGNLASTLAGQFSFTYSLAFANLAIAFISNFLTVRFTTSLLANLEYTTNMSYTPYTKISDLVKSDVTPFLVAFAVIFLINSKKIYSRKDTSIFEWSLLIISILLYFYVPEGALWNGRVVSFFNLAVIVIFFKVIESSMEEIFKYEQGNIIVKSLSAILLFVYLFNFFQKWNIASYKIFIYPVLLMALIGIVYFFSSSADIFKLSFAFSIILTVTFLPYWVSWNFNGYENKEQWSDIDSLYSNLNELPPGRIMWEPNADLNKYGTPMVLMTIPLYTHHSSMEGLYFDSSITTPFHFIAISGLAERPSNPVGGLRYINNQFEQGQQYLEDLGVDYFITYTDTITEKSQASEKLNFLFSSGPFSVFNIESEKIELVTQNIIEFEKIPFLERTMSSIFRNTDYSNFFTSAYENFSNLDSERIIEVSNTPSKLKKSLSDKAEITNLKITSNTISFTTDRPNELHQIKVSYFPNWKIVNGEGPYRISPSFMAIVPNSENVELTFIKTQKESNSFYIALFSLLFFVGLSQKRKTGE